MDNVCNRCLCSIPSKVEMAEEQEYLRYFLMFCICPHTCALANDAQIVRSRDTQFSLSGLPLFE